MEEPDYQTPETSGGSSASNQPGMMIRGADGALYIVTEKDLAPFRVSDAKTRKLAEMLEEAPTKIVSYELAPDLMRAVAEVAKCVSANIEVKIPKR